MKEKTIHFFRVPNEWNQEKIKDFIEEIKKLDKRQCMVSRKEVQYIPIELKEGDKIRIIENNKILEVIA